MEAHAGLPVLERRKFLRARGGDGRIARNDLLDEATHRLDSERERNDVEQQPVFTLRLVAHQHVRLHRGAERHHFVRVEVVERIALEEFRHRALNLGHAGGAAHHDDAVNLIRGETGVAQRLAHRAEGLLHERLRDAAERFRIDRHVDELAGR